MSYCCLIKDLNCIRDQIRELIVNAHKMRTDYSANQRSYDTLVHRLKQWFNDDIIVECTEARKKKYFITFDDNTPHNPLFKIYKMHALRSNSSMSSYFVLMDILRNRTLSKNEILDAWEERYHNIEFPIKIGEGESCLRNQTEAGILSISTLDRYLKKFERDYGIVKASKQRNKDLYSLYQPAFELERWRDAFDYYSEISPLGVVGSYLTDRLNRRDYTLQYNSREANAFNDSNHPFVFNHHYREFALEYEVVETLLEAIAKCKSVILHNSKLSSVRKAECVPLKLYVSARSGRQYVLACDCDGIQPRTYRIDRIQEVIISKKNTNYKVFRHWISEFEKHLWGVYLDDFGKTDHVEITFRIPSGEESTLRRLEAEKRCGQIVKIGDDKWRYIADVHCSEEMMPWIRSFMGYICSLKSSNTKLESNFKAEMAEIREMYGLLK